MHLSPGARMAWRLPCHDPHAPLAGKGEGATRTALTDGQVRGTKPLDLFDQYGQYGSVIRRSNPTTSLERVDQICTRRIAAFQSQATKGSSFFMYP